MNSNNFNNNNVENPNKAKHVGGVVKNGITFGSCLAMIISYTTWKSIGWAIIHGIFSWAYVIYYLIKYV
ncbi:MAG: hypothetical protein GX288_07185 [Clostridiales bacterium]|jgi:hypothetical protein|nr:hypothetical protein [Clostridiales bacterium]